MLRSRSDAYISRFGDFRGDDDNNRLLYPLCACARGNEGQSPVLNIGKVKGISMVYMEAAHILIGCWSSRNLLSLEDYYYFIIIIIISDFTD